MENKWPTATAQFDAVSGTIKDEYEDFKVEEIPAYEPSGEGTHVYFTIEKRGLSTGRAINDIAKALGIKTRNIGYAGMKDARGITVQTLSVEHVPIERVEALDLPRIRVLKVKHHRNKFKIGHLKGNRFTIKLRDVPPERMDDIRAMVAVLTRRGVPNYFGLQRFGNRGDTWEVGKAILLGEFDQAAAIIAGNAGEADEGRVLEARQLFDKGEYAEAARAWPRGFSECQNLCYALARGTAQEMPQGTARGNSLARDAILGLPPKTLKLYISAYQSFLFNNVLARRLEHYDAVMTGDLAWKHQNGAAFMVEDGAVEMPRATAFEISATGPLFGPKMTLPSGEVLALEEEILAQEGITRDLFAQKGPLKTSGGRRPLRFFPADLTCTVDSDDRGSFVEFRFALPPGCYATSLFREICKDGMNSVLR